MKITIKQWFWIVLFLFVGNILHAQDRELMYEKLIKAVDNKKLDTVIIFSNQMLAANKSDTPIYAFRGWAYFLKGEETKKKDYYQKALLDFRQFIAYRQDYAPAYYWRARTQLAMVDYTKDKNEKLKLLKNSKINLKTATKFNIYDADNIEGYMKKIDEGIKKLK